jgi:acylphosphatase
MSDSGVERITVHYRGHVQGVGFRYTAAQIAQGYRVEGFVQNLPDGQVLLVAEGAMREINGLLEAIAARMAGFVRQATSDRGPATGEFTGFTVRA